jgi:hypothetical protein
MLSCWVQTILHPELYIVIVAGKNIPVFPALFSAMNVRNMTPHTEPTNAKGGVEIDPSILVAVLNMR